MGDYVRAWRSGRVVCLAVSRTVSEGLLTVLDELECALTGQRKGPFWRRPRPLPDRRLFPDAYFDREASEEFRARHGDLMRRRVLDAVRRTLLLVGHAHEAGDEPVVVPVSEDAVPDVFCAFAHAQAPYLSRPRWNARVDWPTVPLLRGGRELTWLVTCQTALAEAALTEPEESEDVQVSTA
ncbi:hypothetical protein [Saccharomonospora viridis]|jgi:hypothetical protein|uniref:Uncharacterized protein n=2 Tax=Saccharomonospora viridis TaxID=1852 RepID=C7MWC8_SACVD|nr:hypothetical protein [Saccharomonospora viridis]ACU97897.1 hypothetical protein Svir_29190 [Saccharomonospora viridis DSM 43017]KHF45863.1 hypothetical protein MINT15_01640 [Saccharomonospora viridis]SFP40884.1 hypothetical protein SAMN02982918_2218 [Saccharomonospora viridis]